MKEIYYVQMTDGDDYEICERPVGYFSTLEKANEAAKKCAEQLFHDYDEIKEDDGTKTYRNHYYEISTCKCALDEYLPNNW